LLPQRSKHPREMVITPKASSSIESLYQSAVATRPQPPKPVLLRDAGFAALCGGPERWRLVARLWLCEDFIDRHAPPPP